MAQVAEILKNAKKDKPKHWKHYSQLIDGGNGHGRSTLVYWYEQLEKNPDWKPTQEACGKKNQILSPQGENHVWSAINDVFIKEMLLFSDAQAGTLARDVVKKLPAALQPKTEFKGSAHWVQRFRKKHMVSLRAPHLRRRPEQNLRSITNFVYKLTEALNSGMNRRFIVNADETNWPVIFANKKTWAVTKGKKSQKSNIVAKVNGDKKSSFTVMAAITANGDALPLFMLAKGKSPLCERQLEEQDQNKVYHSPNGWVTIDVMEQYFVFLRKVMEEQVALGERDRILLLIDCYASHR
jgi:hypothetical protein